jgi:hypothetical protein
MKLTAFPTLIAAAGLTVALPQSLSSPQVDQTYYYFRTSVQSGQPTAYDNYYITSYHTGAGLADATFVEGTPFNGQVGWFNGTYLNWFYPDNIPGDGPFSLQYQVGGSTYAQWSPVSFVLSLIIVPRCANDINLEANRLL